MLLETEHGSIYRIKKEGVRITVTKVAGGDTRKIPPKMSFQGDRMEFDKDGLLLYQGKVIVYRTTKLVDF